MTEVNATTNISGDTTFIGPGGQERTYDQLRSGTPQEQQRAARLNTQVNDLPPSIGQTLEEYPGKIIKFGKENLGKILLGAAIVVVLGLGVTWAVMGWSPADIWNGLTVAWEAVSNTFSPIIDFSLVIMIPYIFADWARTGTPIFGG